MVLFTELWAGCRGTTENVVGPGFWNSRAVNAPSFTSMDKRRELLWNHRGESCGEELP